jgi:hypothetical protein
MHISASFPAPTKDVSPDHRTRLLGHRLESCLFSFPIVLPADRVQQCNTISGWSCTGGFHCQSSSYDLGTGLPGRSQRIIRITNTKVFPIATTQDVFSDGAFIFHTYICTFLYIYLHIDTYIYINMI